MQQRPARTPVRARLDQLAVPAARMPTAEDLSRLEAREKELGIQPDSKVRGAWFFQHEFKIPPWLVTALRQSRQGDSRFDWGASLPHLSCLFPP